LSPQLSLNHKKNSQRLYLVNLSIPLLLRESVVNGGEALRHNSIDTIRAEMKIIGY